MKETELRIGNYVFDAKSNNIQSITGLTMDHVFVSQFPIYSLTYEQIHPIKVTEDSLEIIGIQIAEYDSLCEVMDYIMGGQSSVRLRYIHQVQNFKYSIEGTE